MMLFGSIRNVSSFSASTMSLYNEKCSAPFHGKKDRDFCLVSETNLHINGHFIGKSKKEGLKRDFTWVQSIGMQFDSHKLYLGTNKVATWDDAHDEHSVFLDDQPIVLPPARGAEWESVVGHNSPEY